MTLPSVVVWMNSHLGTGYCRPEVLAASLTPSWSASAQVGWGEMLMEQDAGSASLARQRFASLAATVVAGGVTVPPCATCIDVEAALLRTTDPRQCFAALAECGTKIEALFLDGVQALGWFGLPWQRIDRSHEQDTALQHVAAAWIVGRRLTFMPALYRPIGQPLRVWLRRVDQVCDAIAEVTSLVDGESGATAPAILPIITPRYAPIVDHVPANREAIQDQIRPIDDKSLGRMVEDLAAAMVSRGWEPRVSLWGGDRWDLYAGSKHVPSDVRGPDGWSDLDRYHRDVIEIVAGAIEGGG